MYVYNYLLFGVFFCVLSDLEGTVTEQSPGGHFAVTRKFISVSAGDDTYFGDLSLSSRRFTPVLRRLESDMMFDVSLYDRITIEENKEFEVYDEGATNVVSGNKVLLWVFDHSSVQFRNAMSLMFGNEQDFSRFMHSLHQYTGS
ncbi:uncharacterized protein LOC117322826 [Pecten maximus]|uniref:uncharacterized protein LOC117322826 n=1 Tax=Pecten maximus TaxID=6579 RepID=UPI001458FE9B|nr:uncharacterized protein LOC117322826 [Pecten maximus]